MLFTQDLGPQYYLDISRKEQARRLREPAAIHSSSGRSAG